MLLVAVLLLPLVSVLLVVMDRMEDRLFEPAPERARHAGHRRHLRLVPGGRRPAGDLPRTKRPEENRADDAPAQGDSAKNGAAGEARGEDHPAGGGPAENGPTEDRPAEGGPADERRPAA